MDSENIKEISVEEAERIITACQPRGLYMVISGNLFIGIDNLSGDAWVEEFQNKNDCIGWLLGLDDFLI